MKYNWILDVIADLQTFAVANDLGALAAGLTEMKQVAASEISRKVALESHGETSGPTEPRSQ